MRFDDDLDENRGGLPIIYMAIGVSVFIFVVLLMVVLMNRNKNTNQVKDYINNAAPTVAELEGEEPDAPITKRVASDLDIWDMYPEHPVADEDELDVTPSAKVTPSPTVSAAVTPEYEDGKHVKIIYKDGSEEWVAINDKLEKNNYDFTSLVNNGGILKYYSDGKNVSFSGIDVSRYQKDIDFGRVKAQDIDFVMIRVGARGYKNGELTLDEYFETNLKNATDAGLDIGVYFYSQATTVAEAEEEANLVLNAIAEKKIKYPIAFDMEFVDNDTARIDTLSRDEKTQVTAAFVNKIKDAGYRPMIYGNKEWLLKRIDVSKFTSSSIWLAQYEDYPDYPYTYDMWQYSTDGSLFGIDGKVDLDICFVDYAAQ